MRTQTNNPLMINLFRLIMISMFLVGVLGHPTGRVHAATVIYVKSGATGADNGTSWEDAYTSLQVAIHNAVSGDEIWVAAGTYYPYPPAVPDPDPTPPDDAERRVYFTLKDGVHIYGGFNGTEDQLSGRDPDVNVTILSGDLNRDDVGFTNNSENSYHVVYGGGAGNTAVLDGFTITQGNGDHLVPGSDEQYGGGMLNLTSSPTLSNLIITGNKARYGAGMLNKSSSNPIMTNVVFSNNTAERGAGMFNTIGSDPELTDVTFSNNTVNGRGGAMHNAEFSTPVLTNVTFSGNSAKWGGGLSNTDALAVMFNVTFSGNSAEYGGAIHNEGSNPELTNVTISNNTASVSGGGIYNHSSDPVITNSIIYGNSNGQIVDTFSAPVVSYSIVQGGYTGTGNLTGDPKLLPLADNGGFTQTRALDSGSAAIDAGDDANCPAKDQRGFTRPQGAHCDMGAYEVDNQAPETTLVSFPPNPDSDNTPTFTFSGDDDGGSGVTSFLCRMDGDPYVPCTSPFTSTPLSAGSHTFDVYAVDHASNADPTPASHTWTLEFTPTDVTSIVRTDTSPTSLGSVDFTVTFSANVSGVDSSDFELTTSGVSGASITGVTGSGSSYTVSVNTGAGDGTIRLDIPATTDIQDSIGNQPFNLPYTSGETYKIVKVGTFNDVPNTYWAWRWIESFYDQGITTGCTQSPLNYCPDRQVTRAEMAVFILRAKYGSDYQPNPTQNDIFEDVPVAGKAWMKPWIEQFFEEGITTGCNQSPLMYCPERPVTRAEMAVFIDRAFGILPLP